MGGNPYPIHRPNVTMMGEVRDLREKVSDLEERLTASRNAATAAYVQFLAADRENERLRATVEDLKRNNVVLLDSLKEEGKLLIHKMTMWEKIDMLESNLKGAQEHNRALPQEQRSNEMWTRAEWKPIEHLVGPEEAAKFKQVGENGAVYSYQHDETRQYLHINSITGQCYDRNKNEIDKDVALSNALSPGPAQVRAMPEERKDLGVGMQMAG